MESKLSSIYTASPFVKDPRNIFSKVHHRVHTLVGQYVTQSARCFYLRLRGAHIGVYNIIPKIFVSWPHQLSIGNNCNLEPGINFSHAGCLRTGPNIRIGDRVFIGKNSEFNIWSSIEIGDDCLFASGCKFTDFHHENSDLNIPINKQPCSGVPIRIEANVWLGTNVIVLKGVTIGHGAVVGAGSVVTKSIPPNEVWAGVPARKIKSRE